MKHLSKTIRIKVFFLLSVLLLCTQCIGEKESAATDYIYQTPSVSADICSVNVENLSPEERLAVLSLQGIVNRERAEIYTFVKQDAWLKEFYRNRGIISNDSLYTDFYSLLARFSNKIQGILICDFEQSHTINLATNLAGVENRIIISPTMLEHVQQVTGLTDVVDLRTLKLTNEKEAFLWYRTHVFPRQNHKMLSVAKGGNFMYDVFRDYLVEFKVPVFWLPGKNDLDYDAEYDELVREWLAELPVNIPVLGFWAGTENGKDIGYAEFDGVKLAGLYGKFTLVNTWVGNYSYHSGIPSAQKSFYQKAPREKQYHTYDPNKKYVALIMNESGDAPCYFLYTGFYPRQWLDPERGKVAISYGITPSLRFLAPGVLADLYDTQTENDFFFCSISGAGYCYPFEGYGSGTASPAACLQEYFGTMTAANMRKLDLDMLGLYTHTQSMWTLDDYKIAKEFIFPMQGLKSVISGMHRTEYTAADAHELADSTSVHHTVTFWSTANFQWNDESLDEEAVDFLENEIKTYGKDGQFIQAMFYSWHYGPRRLNMLRQRLERDGYVFVTLNEFDYLWRYSNSGSPCNSKSYSHIP